MSYDPSPLPELTVNRSFMVEFVTADTPCFAMGLVEEEGKTYGFLGFRPNESIPPAGLLHAFGDPKNGRSRFDQLEKQIIFI